MERSGRDLVLILGAGPAGLAAAVEMAKSGRRAVLVDRAETPGGLARRLGCKATNRCAGCGACLVWDLLDQARAETKVEFLPGGRLAGLSPSDGGYLADLDLAGASRRVEVAGVVVATGAEAGGPADARFGLGRLPDVITGLDLEEMARRDGLVRRPSDGAAPRRVAFIQCAGSRDRRGEQAACSRICCGYGLRLAAWLKHGRPETEISFFYMDLQTVGRGMDRFLPGLDLIRALPGLIRPAQEGGLELVFQPENGLDRETRLADLVVLSVGLLRRPDNPALAGLLGLNLDENGFLIPDPDRRILVAGAAGGPRGIAESIEQGRLAGRLAASSWKGGSVR